MPRYLTNVGVYALGFGGAECGLFAGFFFAVMLFDFADGFVAKGECAGTDGECYRFGHFGVGMMSCSDVLMKFEGKK